jgi:hypothetical protein
VPQPKIFCRNEFVSYDPAMHGAESCNVARIHHLFGRGREEVRGRLRAQDQNPVPARRNRKRTTDLAAHVDGIVRAGGDAPAAPDARLVHHLHDGAGNRNGVGRADPHTSEATDAAISTYGEFHRTGMVEDP